MDLKIILLKTLSNVGSSKFSVCHRRSLTLQFPSLHPVKSFFSRRVRLASRQYHLSLRYKTILSQVPENLKFSQINCHSRYSSLRLLKSWPNGLASRRKFWTCVSFGHQLASTCDDLRRLVLTMIELKFGRK